MLQQSIIGFLDRVKYNLSAIAKEVEESNRMQKNKVKRGAGAGGNSAPTIDNFQTIFSTQEQHLKALSSKARDLQTTLNDLDKEYANFLRNGMPSADGSAKADPTLFDTLFNKFNMERGDAYGETIARHRVYDAMMANQMIPSEVLRVNLTDRAVFVFVSLLFRTVALSIVEWTIETHRINQMFHGVLLFLGIYSALFIGFVMAVNFDAYRMRIIFNYVNFHANASYVYMHFILLWILGLLVFFIMRTINYPVPGVADTVMSEEEKVRMVYRMQILTMILWIMLFIVILVA
jgi:hypothetical protein